MFCHKVHNFGIIILYALLMFDIFGKVLIFFLFPYRVPLYYFLYNNNNIVLTTFTKIIITLCIALNYYCINLAGKNKPQH